MRFPVHVGGGAPSLPVRPKPVTFASSPGLAGIISPQRADPEAEIGEDQRYSGENDRQLLSGRARGAHSHEPPKARWDHVRRSGAVAMPLFAGGRCAQRAWCTGRRDFIGEQLSDASAHTIRAGEGPANYLST